MLEHPQYQGLVNPLGLERQQPLASLLHQQLQLRLGRLQHLAAPLGRLQPCPLALAHQLRLLAPWGEAGLVPLLLQQLKEAALVAILLPPSAAKEEDKAAVALVPLPARQGVGSADLQGQRAEAAAARLVVAVVPLVGAVQLAAAALVRLVPRQGRAGLLVAALDRRHLVQLATTKLPTFGRLGSDQYVDVLAGTHVGCAIH